MNFEGSFFDTFPAYFKKLFSLTANKGDLLKILVFTVKVKKSGTVYVLRKAISKGKLVPEAGVEPARA